MMKTTAPDYHPLADEMQGWLAATFGPMAPQALVTIQASLGNPLLMQVMDALCFVHEPVDAEDIRTEHKREGMRRVALSFHACRSLDPNQLSTVVNSKGNEP